MAFEYFPVDQTKPRTIRMRNQLNNLYQSVYGADGLLNEIANMQLMINGDGTQDAHYDEIRVQYGYPDVATARAGWNELNSVAGKFNVDNPATNITAVKAAILQAFNKFR